MKLLTTAWFPPIEYFAVLAKCSVFIDGTEHYQKQSWRNRCRILTATGPEDLRFPVLHNGERDITRVQVDYRTPWLRRTEYAIDSAYYSSPFFEYYRDELFALLDSQPQTLWELNSLITDFFCRKVGIPAPGTLLEPAQGEVERIVIHPKVPSCWQGRPYWQVFRDKFGFVDGLSIMDLLFNEGPESICYLQK